MSCRGGPGKPYPQKAVEEHTELIMKSSKYEWLVKLATKTGRCLKKKATTGKV